MEKFSKEWFELTDHRRRLLSRAVWIPVYGVTHPIQDGEYPEVGHIEETFAVGSAIIYNGLKKKAEELDWHYWSVNDSQVHVDKDGEYHQADAFHDTPEGYLGFNLILSQHFNSSHTRKVTVHQDFLFAYNLYQEGDIWLRPHEGYEEVIRQTKDESGEVKLIEIRAEYLKDYLAARNASLRLYYYRERRAILKEDPQFDWPKDFALIDEPHYKCEVRCDQIDSSGDFPGASWAIMKSWRTDVDPEEEVPDFTNQDDSNTSSETTEGVRPSEGLRFRVTGELCRGEWIEPAKKACRIGWEEPKETLLVTLDGGGEKVGLDTLNFEEVGKYLWFEPQVINSLLAKRGGHLSWYTKDTGGVSASPDSSVHFGVNKLGLINAYAYDIARRPLWEQRIWVSHNCRPDGGVSAELMEAQMECEPASTKAPEELALHAINWLEDVFQRKFIQPLLRDHGEVEALMPRIHRFRAVDESSLRSLAKDLVKMTVERINKKALLNALGEKKSEFGTLKLLQHLLESHTSKEYAHKRMTPLFGLYDLRGADAHLTNSNVEECYSRLEVNRDGNFVDQASQIIEIVSDTLGVIGADLNKHA